MNLWDDILARIETKVNRYTFHTLLRVPGTTFLDIQRLLQNAKFREQVVAKANFLPLTEFWEEQFAQYPKDAPQPILNRMTKFTLNPTLQAILGQPQSYLNFFDVLQNNKILLVNLSQGKIGSDTSQLLGSLIVSQLQLATMHRANLAKEQRQPFYLYVDEFQNFITDAFSSILSEARKYRLNLIIAHQFLGQLEQGAGTQGAASHDLRDAVFGNAGTMTAFRIGVEDAEIMAKEFAPIFNEFDLVNIDRFNAYIKLMINGTASKPFNMATYPLPKPDATGLELASSVRQLSRLKFGRVRAEVEAEVLEASQVADMMSAGPASVEKGL